MYPRLHCPKNFNAHPGAKFEQYSNRSSYHSGMGGEYEVKMPAGYNPSDDSEDDYNPSSLSKKIKRNNKSGSDSDESNIELKRQRNKEHQIG